jgi:hypothetical protein
MWNASAELTALAGEIERRFDALVRSVPYHADQGEPKAVALAVERLMVAKEGRPASARDGVPEGSRARGGARPAPEADAQEQAEAGARREAARFRRGQGRGTKVGARAARLADAVAQALGEL